MYQLNVWRNIGDDEQFNEEFITKEMLKPEEEQLQKPKRQ